ERAKLRVMVGPSAWQWRHAEYGAPPAREHRTMGGNFFKTALLLTALTVLFMWLGYALFGTQGMVWAFLLAVGMNFFSYWFSDQIALSMSGAHEVSPQEAPP